MQFESRADHNDTSCRIVDPLSEKVFAKSSLFTFDHVGQRFQGAIAASQHGAFAPIVVEQCVDRLLQHSLFISNDDFWSVQVDKFSEAIVSVDDPTIKIIQVAGREVARVEQDQWAKVGRNDRDNVHHHPLGTIVAVSDRLHNFQSIGQVLATLLRIGLRHFLTKLLREFYQIQALEQFANRFRTHFGFEAPFAILFTCGAKLFFGE